MYASEIEYFQAKLRTIKSPEEKEKLKQEMAESLLNHLKGVENKYEKARHN